MSTEVEAVEPFRPGDHVTWTQGGVKFRGVLDLCINATAGLWRVALPSGHTEGVLEDKMTRVSTAAEVERRHRDTIRIQIETVRRGVLKLGEMFVEAPQNGAHLQQDDIEHDMTALYRHLRSLERISHEEI